MSEQTKEQVAAAAAAEATRKAAEAEAEKKAAAEAEKAAEPKFGALNNVTNISKRDVGLTSGIIKPGGKGVATLAECCNLHKYLKFSSKVKQEG